VLGRIGVERLREALIASGYTAEGVSARTQAATGLSGDGVSIPASGDRLGTLINMFIDGRVESAAAAAAALAPLSLADALAAGVAEPCVDGVRAGAPVVRWSGGRRKAGSKP